MPRPGADVGKTQPLEQAADCGLIEIDTVAIPDNLSEIDSAPLLHASMFRLRAGLDQFSDLLFLFRAELGGPTRGRRVHRPSGPSALKAITQSRSVCASMAPSLIGIVHTAGKGSEILHPEIGS